MNADQWLGRAGRTLSSASILLENGDADRSCSTAYYAMFYAARAALFHVRQPERALGKTHSGMIASFHQYLVRPGLIDVQQGRTLQNEFGRRLAADYDIDGVDASGAAEAISSAQSFVAAIRDLIERTA